MTFRLCKHVIVSYDLCFILRRFWLCENMYLWMRILWCYSLQFNETNRLLYPWHVGTINSCQRRLTKFRECHPKIVDDKRYYPFFKDAIGAIDGTHIKCVVKGCVKDKYVGRKGYSTQNVMAVCDWDMCFTFVLAGWEGSAHDARLFQTALSTPSMNFPHPPKGIFLKTKFN